MYTFLFLILIWIKNNSKIFIHNSEILSIEAYYQISYKFYTLYNLYDHNIDIV